MKKFFRNREESYEEDLNSQEWEEMDDLQEDNWEGSESEEYYAEEGEPEEEYYTEEGELEEEYYTEEGEPEEGYYAEEGEPEEGYYAEEGEPEEEYYAEEGELEEEYYAQDDESYEAAYLEDGSEYGFEDEEQVPDWRMEEGGSRRRKRGLIGAFLEMGLMDKIITCTGMVVLLFALVTGGIYLSARMLDDQVDSFVSVGNQLEDIDLPGEAGLLAVADAQAAKKAAAQAMEELKEQEEEEPAKYEEQEYANAVTVSMHISSIQKDLKIKFLNKKTDKLISNVPFQVSVTDPNGKSSTWKDDDMDGIIYQTELTPGKYKIAVLELSGDKYKEYTLPDTAQSAEVKKDIEYKKVDVKDEIKTEAEVNVAKEDTKKNETQVENKLENTVNWVESTTTMINYQEVEKSTITDPAAIVYQGSFQRLSQAVGISYTGSISESSRTLTVGDSFTLTAAAQGVNLTEVTWTSSNPSVATVDAGGVVKAISQGNAVISYQAKGTAVSGGDAVTGLQASCQVTVQSQLVKGKVTVDKETVAVAVGASAVVKASAADFLTGKELKFHAVSDKEAIAKASADANGGITITGVAEGEAVVTVTADYQEGGSDDTRAQTTIAVKVAGERTIKLDQATAMVYIGIPAVLKATVTNALTDAPLTALSSDTAVATVAVNGKEITVTGLKEGSAVITVKHTENNQEISAACTVTVRLDPKQDKTRLLKDVDGNQIFVEEGGNYREAVYADYYTAAKFYIKGEAKYTGWQTINGKVYYFDANGKKVTGEQVIQGAKYTFGADGVLSTGAGSRGIDVSKWNGNIDWTAVKNSGIEYVIIRCGYRGSSQGSLIEDPKFQTNIKGANAAGLKVGVYFFTQAVSEAEAVEEASMVLEQVKNYKITYPIFLDVEASGGRGDRIDKETRTAVCKAFCQTIQSAGYTAGIYANKTWLTEKLDAGALSAYKIWLAQYAQTPTYSGRYDLWQYQSTGRVSGISGDVDMNWSYLGY